MISDNLHEVKLRIAQACAEFGRVATDVRLLAVSKTFPSEAITEAYAAGQRAFGENYIQEGVEKVQQLSSQLPGVEWHMIGLIQSNKTRLVAEHFHWAHSVDRLKTAQRLSEQRPEVLPPLQICLQVNIDGGANKAGCLAEQALELAHDVAQLPRLVLRGLMVIPEPAADFASERAVFAQAQALITQLQGHYPKMDTLSMGMSQDLRAAIAQGSTMVRIGTAIFGQRPPHQPLKTLQNK